MMASEETDFRLPESLVKKVVPVAGLVGMAAIVAGLALGLAGAVSMEHLALAYLHNLWFFVTICLGGLFFVLVHHVVGAKWSIVVRRLGEVVIGNFPLLGLLAIPIVVVTLLGDGSFFRWADPAKVAENELVQAKRAYLNPTFFAIRAVVYFGVWTLIAFYFIRGSCRQDEQGHDEARALRMRQVAAPCLIVFGFTLTFASIDFIMSLEPEWFSTIFGVYIFGGSALAFFCSLAIVSMWLEKRRLLPITTEHFHDIGKYMFGFIVFWSYIAFSQFMLIWYANIPEETAWFLHRSSGFWEGMAIALIIGHFVLPFLGLVSRHIKRRRATLLFWAVWILAIHWIDLYWLVMPSMHGGAHEHVVQTAVPFHPVDFLFLLGFGSLFLAGLFFRAGSRSLVPVKDPRLEESLAFKNF